jgi:hypothetical protein
MILRYNGEESGMFWMALPIVLAAGSASEPANCEATKPSQMAEGAAFYINGDDIEFEGAKYARYGLPRILLDADLVIVGDYRGVLVGAAEYAPEDREIIYLLVDGECTYEPYKQN